MIENNLEKLGELNLKLNLDLSQAKAEIKECIEFIKAFEYLSLEQEKVVFKRIKHLKESLKGTESVVESLEDKR